MLHIYLFSKKIPVTSCLLPQVLVYRQLALASTYLIVPASTRVYGGALDIAYFSVSPATLSRTCLPYHVQPGVKLEITATRVIIILGQGHQR